MMREVAPGIHRLGNELVNFYVVEDGSRLALVDAGLPGFRGQLEEFLTGRGRTLGDIEAVLLTHAHGDHVGVAEIVRQAGATVHVHEADAEMARTAKPQSRERGMRPYFRYGATWRLLITGLRLGAARTPKIASVSTFAEGDELDVPGHPRIVHAPGHSNGHVVLPLPGPRRPAGRRRGRHLQPSDRPPGAADHAGRLQRLERTGDGVAGADRVVGGGGAGRGPRRSLDRRGCGGRRAGSRGGPS